MSESSSRSWWFSSKLTKPSKDIRRSLSMSQKQPSTGIKFNTFASVLRFKSKKLHPSLTIQDPPPLPVHHVHQHPPQPQPQPPPPPQPTAPTNNSYRPPSNSVSTIRSSLEPRTPSDPPHKDTLPFRQSLLTLSDSDPFASSGISLSALAQDLSADGHFLSPSPPDPFSNEKSATLMPLDRNSYASSSSQSATDIWWRNTLASAGSLPERNPSTNVLESPGSENLTAISHVATPHARIRTISKSGSSSTITGLPNTSPPNQSAAPIPEPSLSKSSSRDGSPSSTSSTPPPALAVSHRPSVLSRHLSSSRPVKPPSTPPTHNLPLPPADSISPDDLSTYLIPSNLASPASSVLSFAASHTDEDVETSPRSRSRYRAIKGKTHAPSPDRSGSHGEDADCDRESLRLPKPSMSATFLPQSNEITRPLKKAASHQSFSSKHGSITSPGSVSSIISDDTPPDRQPLKQRSFHHPRIPQSLRHPSSNSYNTPTFTTAASHMDSAENADKRKGIAATPASTPTKKRLFTGSSLRRPSTTPSDFSDHDTRSQMSLSPEGERRNTSELDDSDTLSAPVSASSGYVPQRIMSPAEMLEVEASVQDGTDDSRFVRQRGLSSTSSLSTYTSELFTDFAFPGSLSPSSSSTIDNVQIHSLPIRSASVRSSALSSPRPGLGPRPATSHTYSSPPSSPTATYSVHSPSSATPEPVPLSLPPPPRRRYRPPTEDCEPCNRQSVVRLTPLSPPPMRQKRCSNNPSLESTILRRAIMKKPSFLDIDVEDEVVADDNNATSTACKPPDDSFLDLNRDSFDTVRSLPARDGRP